MSSRITIKEIFATSKVGNSVHAAGWVRSVRKNKTFCFIVLNDGSCQDNLQVVVNDDSADYEKIAALLTGSAIAVQGDVVESGGKGQSIELQGKEVTPEMMYGVIANTYITAQAVGSVMEKIPGVDLSSTEGQNFLKFLTPAIQKSAGSTSRRG